MKTTHWAGLTLYAFLVGIGTPVHAADAPKDSSTADQTDNNYYWQGTQLYNLGRLGEAFDSFEKAIQRKQNSKEAEAYLLQIRQDCPGHPDRCLHQHWLQNIRQQMPNQNPRMRRAQRPRAASSRSIRRRSRCEH